jgi:hypothetical protein
MSELMLDVGQANELKMAFRRAGYEAGDVKALSEGDVLAQVREVLLGRARIVPIEMEMLPVAQATCNTFTVLPNLSLAERINAGSYGWVNSDIIEKRFPHNPTTVGTWEWELAGFNHGISSEDAKVALEVDGWIVAKWEHELAYGAAFPEAQRRNPIIALGSVCEMLGYRRVLALWYDYGKRSVGLHHWDVRWNPGYRLFFRTEASELLFYDDDQHNHRC